MANQLDCCAICKSQGRLLRCRSCKKVWYCSAECQKIDWKQHKKVCRLLSQGDIQQSWSELQSLVSNCTIDQANEDYHKALSELQRLKEGEDSRQQSNVRKRLPSESKQADRKILESEQQSDDRMLSKNESGWIFRLEDMGNLMCYQLTIKPRNGIWSIQPQDLIFDVRIIDENSSLLTIRRGSESLELHLLGQIRDTPTVNIANKGGISVRIAYEPNSVAYPDEFLGTQLTLSKNQELVCRSCNHRLLPAGTIEKVLPTPSGRWDEMDDYLICYPGQSSVDFSATVESQTGVLFYDDTCLTLHQDDLLKQGTCVLCIPPEENNPPVCTGLDRGIHRWEPLVQGASISCSCCCRVLGVIPVDASNKTARLWRHRVQDTSILQFCVQELIRYAETKAIFGMQLQTNTNDCLNLRLLSWDSRSANNLQDLPGLKRTTKMIWEEGARVEETLSWMFGGSIDWCCPPPSSKAAQERVTSSVVTLEMEMDEWQQVKADLTSFSSCYEPEIVRATILAKMGKNCDSSATRLASITF